MRVGQTVDFTVMRDGQEVVLTAQLGGRNGAIKQENSLVPGDNRQFAPADNAGFILQQLAHLEQQLSDVAMQVQNLRQQLMAGHRPNDNAGSQQTRQQGVAEPSLQPGRPAAQSGGRQSGHAPQAVPPSNVP